MKIIIDGDSCFRKDAIIKIAKKRKIPVSIYCDYNHMLYDDYADVHVVDEGFNSVDMYIANSTEKGDVVVTNDTGLAALVLARNGIPLNNYGVLFNQNNIGKRLHQVYLKKTARRKSKRKNFKVDVWQERGKDGLPVKHDFYKSFFEALRLGKGAGKSAE